MCILRDGISTTTGDHVVARQFVPTDLRNNLPKVPCCEGCNNKKSQLEHYLTTILPFSGRHSYAEKTLISTQRRLSKNQGLAREIEKSFVLDQRIDAGDVSSLLTITFDSQKLTALSEYIARGLDLVNEGREFKTNIGYYAHSITDFGDTTFRDVYFKSHEGIYNTNSIGGEFLEYESFHASSDQNISFWIFSYFGGIQFAGQTAGDIANKIWVFSGPPKFLAGIMALLEE